MKSSATPGKKQAGVLAGPIRHLRSLLQSLPPTLGQLTRIGVDIPAVALLPLLAGLPDVARRYFSCRNGQLSVAALGEVGRLQPVSGESRAALLDRMAARVAGTDALWVGGFAFADEAGSGAWQQVPSAQWHLPAVELREHHGSFRLSGQLLAQTEDQWCQQREQILRLLERLCWCQLSLQENATGPFQRLDSLNLEQWRQQIRAANLAFSESQSPRLEKAVLAREVLLQHAGTIDPFALLQSWQRKAAKGYGFVMDFPGGQFFGLTPERLYRRRGEHLDTEALAGTVRRGQSADTDFALAQQLQRNAHLVHEHEVVITDLRENLADLVEDIETPKQASVLRLDRIQHRYLPIRAELKSGVSNQQLFERLHPTAAVCGYERSAAQAFIKQHEAFCRGWYAGAVGVVGDDYVELATSIRSAWKTGNELRLYSGVGLVAGCNAEQQWQELEAKIETLLEVLNEHA